MKIIFGLILASLTVFAKAQSTDIFLMPGADVTRPGSGLRSNLNIGIGHTFAALKNSPGGDEITGSYTYENGGSHGFWHTNFGSHTETAGVMRNINFGKSLFGMYLWSQVGITSLTGYDKVHNRMYAGESVGLTCHITRHQGIWAQEAVNWVATEPWYTSSNIGYVFSF